MAKVRRMLFCPECNSTDLYYEIGGITGFIYHCKRCNYMGPLVIEEEFDEDELRSMVEESEKESPIEPVQKKRRRWFKDKGL
jgi:DNA-directed RNA polymerase subunit M/transcription elongation factor TFIIS